MNSIMNSLHVYKQPSFTCHIAVQDAEVDLLIRTGLHNRGQEIGVPLTRPGFYRLQINGGICFYDRALDDLLLP